MAPGDGTDIGHERAAQRFPAAPCGAVPPPVPQPVVLAEREDVKAIGPPRDGAAWGRGDDAAQRLPACPQERDLRDRVTPNPHTGQHRVVEIAVLLDDGGMIGCSEQAVIAVGHAVDHNELAWQAGRVHVGPADRDALVSARVAAGGSWSGRVCSLDVGQAECLLETWCDLLVGGVQQTVVVEVLDVIMVMRVGPYENAPGGWIRWRRRQ